MKALVPTKTEIEITHIKLDLPVNYGEEDIPLDFPLRNGDLWRAMVNIDTGQIEGWPKGRGGNLNMKVCDSGIYTLYRYGKEMACIENDYVPTGVVPGEYGDYVDLKINEDGVITNWPKAPDVEAFFPSEDE